MKRSIGFLCSLSLAACLAVTIGCSSNQPADEQDATNPISSESVGSAPAEASPQTQGDPAVISADQLAGSSGLFRLSGDGQSAKAIGAISEVEMSDDPEEWSSNPHYLFGTLYSANSPNYELVTIDRSVGEKLIVTGEVAGALEYALYAGAVKEYGYWSGDKDEGEGTTLGCYLDEVNGVELQDRDSGEVNDALAGTDIVYSVIPDHYGIAFFHSPVPTTLTWGQYQDSEFVQGVLGLSTYFFLTDRNAGLSLEYERTKNGYFILLIDSLDPGVYVVSDPIDEFLFAMEVK